MEIEFPDKTPEQLIVNGKTYKRVENGEIVKTGYIAIKKYNGEREEDFEEHTPGLRFTNYVMVNNETAHTVFYNLNQ